MECAVYGLFDPVTDECRYIGSARDLAERCRQHVYSPVSMGMRLWLAELNAAGLQFISRVLATTSELLRYEIERALIVHYGRTCRLLNVNLPRRAALYRRDVTRWKVVQGPPQELSTSARGILRGLTGDVNTSSVDWVVQEALEYANLKEMLFEEMHPELAEDCDLEENGDLEPEHREINLAHEHHPALWRADEKQDEAHVIVARAIREQTAIMHLNEDATALMTVQGKKAQTKQREAEAD